MSKRPPLDEIRELLLNDSPRQSKAEQIAHHIRRAGNYRWVGIYELNAGEDFVAPQLPRGRR